MKVLVNGSLYEMNRKQCRACLEVARKAVPYGSIYAIEKDGLCEMRKEVFDNFTLMMESVAEYREKGFKVYYNLRG